MEVLVDELMRLRLQINGKTATMKFPERFSAYVEKTLEMDAFKTWCTSVDKEFTVDYIEVQSIDVFNDKVNFIKFRADVTDKDNTKIPSIVFLRGATVAVLCVIRLEEPEPNHYVILRNKPRLSTGKYDFADLPSAIVKNYTNVAQDAANVLKKHTNIDVSRERQERANWDTIRTHLYEE